jgi:hypothetical protein
VITRRAEKWEREREISRTTVSHTPNPRTCPELLSLSLLTCTQLHASPFHLCTSLRLSTRERRSPVTTTQLLYPLLLSHCTRTFSAASSSSPSFSTTDLLHLSRDIIVRADVRFTTRDTDIALCLRPVLLAASSHSTTHCFIGSTIYSTVICCMTYAPRSLQLDRQSTSRSHIAAASVRRSTVSNGSSSTRTGRCFSACRLVGSPTRLPAK